MTTLMIMIFGLMIVILTLFFSFHVFGKIQSSLVSPLSGVSRSSDNNEKNYYLSGLLNIFAISFLCAMFFSLSGGTIGQFAKSNINSVMISGFVIGIIIVALTRISAVFLSTSLASFFQFLLQSTITISLYYLITDTAFFNNLMDTVIRPAWTSNVNGQSIRTASASSYFPLIVLIATMTSVAITEILIYMSKYLPGTYKVPYSLMRERIEQHSFVYQVFDPASVTKIINEKLGENINKNGLYELSWLTGFMQTMHIEKIENELMQWLRGNGTLENELEIKKKKIMNSSIRLIIYDTQSIDDIRRRFPYITRIQKLDNAPRERVLIINDDEAIIHMSLPFEPNELSNCALYTKTRELILILRNEFDLLWEDTWHLKYAQKIVEAFAHMPLNKHVQYLTILQNIYSKNGLIQIEDIEKPQGFNDQDIVTSIDYFKEYELIDYASNHLIITPRYTRICRLNDIVRRLLKQEIR